jgi:hypothetical protein
MNHYVVIVHRDRYSWPKLHITVEHVCKTESAAEKFITNRLRALYDKRSRGHFGRWPSMRVFDFRVVDAVGLRRLQAAAKASVTIRRQRAAQKAAKTRARNLAARRPTLQERMLVESKSDFYGAN